MDPSNDFLDTTPKVQATRSKANKWDYTDLTSFHIAKETIGKMKRQTMEWKKYVNNISDQG